MKLKIGCLFAVMLCSISLLGCSEKPQRLDLEVAPILTGERPVGDMRERTLRQGESGRMDY